MKTLLLKTLPFLISITIGTILFICEEFLIQHEGVSALVMGIASTLFGIPIIFIFYETVTSFSKRHLKSVMTRHIIFEMNYPIVRLLRELAVIFGFKYRLSRQNLHGFLAENRDFSNKTPKFNANTPKKFQHYKDEILKIMQSNSRMDVLPDEIIQSLLSIAEDLGVIALELGEKKKRADIIRHSLELMTSDLEKWIEFCELDAIINHHSFTLER